MSTTARKARKRAGIKFDRTAKVGTPVLQRAWFAVSIWDGKAGKFRSRSAKQIKAALGVRAV